MASSLQLNCHHCGARYRRVQLEPEQWSRCVRCAEVLENYSAFDPRSWLAIILSTIIAFFVANAFPVATLSFQGSAQSTTFLGAVVATWQSGYSPVALLTFLVGFGFPLVLLLVLLALFVPLALKKTPVYFEYGLKLLGSVRPWCMVPVFLLGALVSVVKLVDLAQLEIGMGLYATIVSAIFFTGLAKLTPERVRLMSIDAEIKVARPVEQAPPSPDGLPKAWALLLAAAILYIPANALPVMTITGVSGATSHTILGGVIELAQMGSWELAAVVFIASVFVPLFKILLLAVLLWFTQRRSSIGLRQRTRLYRLIEAISQWSMLDVFVVILLVSLGQFGRLLNIEPGGGAVAFGAVVVLTMMAARSFDSRLAWYVAQSTAQDLDQDLVPVATPQPINNASGTSEPAPIK